MSDLTDGELLSYATIHCRTPVGAFHKSHVERLLRLAGREEDAQRMAGSWKEWWNLGEETVDPLVDAARQNALETAP